MTEITSEALRDPSQFQKLLAEAQAADAGTPAPQAEEQAADPADDAVEEPPVETEEQPEADDAEGGEDSETPEQSDADEQAQPEAQDDEPEEVTKPVPPSRLKKEAEKRRAAEAEAAAAKAEAAAMKAQMAEFNKMLAEQIEASRAPKEPAQAEDPEIDLENIDALDPDTTKALLKEIKALKAELNNVKGETTHQSMLAKATADVASFKLSNPDYDAAVTHLGKMEYEKALALFGNEQQARQAAQAAVGQIANIATASGKSVAQTLYNAAKAVGYRKAEAKPATPAKKPDPVKLAENRAKTESAASVPAAAPNPLGIYTTKEGFDKLRMREGGKVDPAKFAALLKKAQGGKFVA